MGCGTLRSGAWTAALLLLALSAPAQADVEAGIAAYQQGDLVVALREFHWAEKYDDVRALNFLGIMYADGIGTPRDDRQAVNMFYKAAVLGYPEAMANLARMYALGRGGPQDNKAAVAAYRAAAKAGFQPAIGRMAEIYEKGELGESPDAALAREWRERQKGPQTEAGNSPRLEASDRARYVIEAVSVTPQAGRILVRVHTSAPLAAMPASFTLAGPPRIVFDFPHTVTGLGRSFDGIGEELRSVDVVQGSDRTRMVLVLRSMMERDTKLDGRDLLITLSPGESLVKH